MFVAHDGNTTSGSTPTGQQVALDSFVMPGVLTIPANPGNNVITLSRMSPSSDIDVVQLNGVTIFSGPVSSIAGGIVVEHDTPLDAGLADVIPDPNVGNDTLILNYANGDPVPAGGITDNATAGGNNTIEANANASYVLSDSSLTITGATGTDTIMLSNVGIASLTGGPANATFTLSGWSGTTSIAAGSGTNALVVAAGSVPTTSLTVSNVQTLNVTGGTLDVNASFKSIPTVNVTERRHA